MEDYSLLSGLAEGFSQGMDSFRKERQWQLDKARVEEDRARRKRQEDVDMYGKGLKMGPNGAPVPDESNPNYLKQKLESEHLQGLVSGQKQTQQLGLLEKGYKLDDSGGLVRDAENLATKKDEADLAKTLAEAEKARSSATLEGAKAKGLLGKGGLTPKGKRLSATDVLKVNEGNSIPTMLEDVSTMIDNNSSLFSPGTGTLRSLNPWDEQAATAAAQLKASAQAFGRYMEGGVLRKEDEAKYQKMFPQPGDTAKVAKNKLALVQRLLVQKQESNIGALKNSGYDVSGLISAQPAGGLTLPDAPKVLQGKKGLVGQMSSEDKQALAWAQANPNDKRAAAIKQKLGVR